MFVWVSRLVLLFAILTVVYIALSRYSRWYRRKMLEAEYDATMRHEKPRAEHVAEGMAEYDRSLSKKLLLGVFVLPIAIVILLLVIASYM